CCYDGHRQEAVPLAFSADGKLLASGGSDLTLLVWDVTGQAAANPRPRPELSDEEWEGLWSDLAGQEAARAYQACGRLMAAPGPARRGPWAYPPGAPA